MGYGFSGQDPTGVVPEGKEDQRSISKLLKKGVFTMVPLKYKGLGFERYAFDAYNKEAVEATKKLVAEDTRGGFFYGPAGTGKSMLVAVFANEKTKAGKETLFLTAAEIFSETIGAANETERAKFTAKIEKVPCLVIDELDGAHLVKDSGELLIALLKKRAEEKRQTIVASKIPLDEIPAKTEAVGEELKAALAALGEHIVLK